MKLSAEQIKNIDNILEERGVVYVDYKFEILDHIATEVEELMEKSNDNFENTFEKILEKWNPKFKKSATSLFGYFWEMPEILYQKAKKLYWKKMIFLVLLSLVFFPIIILVKDYIPHFSDGIGYFIFTILIFQFIGYIQIRISRQKTTFGFLYKQQFFAFLFLHIIALSILNTNEKIVKESSWDVFPVFFIITNLMLASFFIFKFYKQHFQTIKKNNQLINQIE